MFENFKNLAKLKQMQDEFKKEVLTVERNGISVTMNGNFEVEEIRLNSELKIEDQQKTLKEVLNEVREKIQKNLAQKMLSSGIGF